MKLHQVILAILMFKSLDWLILAFARNPDAPLVPAMAGAIFIWVVLSAAAWVIVDLLVTMFIAGEAAGQGTDRG